MVRETRLVIYTNDAVLLSLAGFPFHVTRWNIISNKTQVIEATQESRIWKLTDRVIGQLQSISPDKKAPQYLTITDRVSLIPSDYCPKIGSMECVTPQGDYLKFKRYMISTKNTIEHDYQSYILNRIWDVWENGVKYYKDYPGFNPEHRRPSVLLLESINEFEPGDRIKAKMRAKNQTALWELFTTITGVNAYSNSPIAEVLYRVSTGREVWEFFPIEQEVAA